MEAKTAHFQGETVVWRGAWHMDIPLDFHIVFNSDCDLRYKDEAAMCIAKFISTSWVAEREAEVECMMEDDDDEEISSD